MVSTAHKKYGFTPDYAISPGETLREVMEYLDMSQKEMATRTGLTVQTLNRIFKGEQPVTYETVNRLELVTGVPTHFWNNLEAQYQEQLAKAEELERLKADLNWLESKQRGSTGTNKMEKFNAKKKLIWEKRPINYYDYFAVLIHTADGGKHHARILRTAPKCFKLYLSEDNFLNLQKEFDSLEKAKNFVEEKCELTHSDTQKNCGLCEGLTSQSRRWFLKIKEEGEK